MGKKGKNGSQGGTAKAAPRALRGAPAASTRKTAGARASAAGPQWGEWVAGLLAGTMVLSLGLGYDAGAYALYFTPRVVIFYPLALAFLLVGVLIIRPGRSPVRVDWLDGVAVLFVVWQLLSVAFSPAPILAWYGVLNRGGGAMLWITATLLFMVGRRVLRGRVALALTGLGAAVVLVLAGLSALMQVFGGETPWGGAQVFLGQGRMTGTTGNPVNLAGLSLLALFVGGLSLFRRDFGRWVRGALGVGAILGVACVVLPVSRAGYLGWAAGLLVCGVVLAASRRWRVLVIVGAVAAAIGILLLSYNPRGEELTGAAESGADATGEIALTESDQSRMEFWRIGLDAVLDRPVVGWGQGAYVVAYRALVSPATIFAKPNVAVSDPHQVAVLLGVGSGFLGLLLGLALLLGPPAVLLSRIRRTGDLGATVPAAAYGVAVLVYLQVSPVDPVVLVPAMLTISAADVGESRCSWVLPALRGGRAVTWALAAVAAVGLVWAAVDGVSFHRADSAFGRSMRTGDASQALRAHELAPSVSEYAQVAGGLLWRRGVNDQDRGLVNSGEAVLRRGLESDPASITIRAELARLYTATTRPQQAVDISRDGLAHSPHYPILQGLWGYSAVVALESLRQPELADSLAGMLEQYPVDSPDGWYWLGRLRAAQGDADGASAAEKMAAELAPQLTAADYQRRLETGQ